MSTYFSKYTGAEVEALLEKVDGEGAIPTKTSELENDSGFITSDALDGYATTSALDGKEDKLAFYSEDGGDATLATDGVVALSGKSGINITTDEAVDINTGSGVNIVSGDVTIADDLVVNGKTTLSGDVTIGDGRKNVSVDISGELQTHGDVYFSPGGISEGRVYYNGSEIATVYDVSAATANIATPADGVNATKNAVLLLTSDDLVAEREKWFDEGSNGYPSAFEVMDYSATTNSVRLRCYCTAASDVMLELDCGGKVLGYYPPFNESDGGVASLYYWYAFDILVPYVDGAFTALQHKYTVVGDGGAIPVGSTIEEP